MPNYKDMVGTVGFMPRLSSRRIPRMRLATKALCLNPDELDWEEVEYHVFQVDKLSEEPK